MQFLSRENEQRLNMSSRPQCISSLVSYRLLRRKGRIDVSRELSSSWLA